MARGAEGNYLAYPEPKSGDFHQAELDPDTGSHNLIVDTDGMVRYAGDRVAPSGG